MKKSLLFGAALVAFGLTAGAQTVQNIPNTTPLAIDGDNAKITIKTMPEDGSEPKARTKTDADGVWQFDNMCDGDVAVLKLNNTVESPYVIKFQTGSKNDGSSILFEILDGSDVEWSEDYAIANNGQWNKFIDVMTFITDPLTTGEKTFRLTFKNINGGTTNVANLRNMVFEAKENIQNYSLYTSVEPGEEAGTILLSPDQNSYLADTEITMTAQANPGYKFNHWENGYGDQFTDNPYTLVITETTDMIAIFDVVSMESELPGYINLDSRTSGKGKPESKNVSLDGEPYNVDEEGVQNPSFYLANYRHNDYEEFAVNVTRDGAYTLVAPTSTKQEAAKVTFKFYDAAAYEADPTIEPESTHSIDAENTGNWQKFVSNKLEGINLTKGKKVLRIEFTEPVASKYTANLLYIGYGIGDDFGSDAVESVSVDAVNVPVKAYNLQGIEVSRDTKGLIILSNGTKVYNK